MKEEINDLGVTESIVPYDGSYHQYMSFSEFTKQVVIHSSKQQKQEIIFTGSKNINRIETWMIFILLFGYLCITFSRSAYRKRFSMLFKTLINWKLSKQIIRYEKVYTHPVNILMTLNFIICFPFFFSVVYTRIFDSSESILFSYFMLITPLLVYILIKLFFYRFSGWLFEQENIIEEYIFQTSLFNKYLGLGFLILTTLLLFSPIEAIILAYLGLAILLLGLLFQIIRGVIIGIENGISLFFIIVYLCTLEITPWLILGKWIKFSL